MNEDTENAYAILTFGYNNEYLLPYPEVSKIVRSLLKGKRLHDRIGGLSWVEPIGIGAVTIIPITKHQYKLLNNNTELRELPCNQPTG